MIRKRLDFDKKSAVAVIPNLLTLSNAICGFGAMVFTAGAAEGWDKTGPLSQAFVDNKLEIAGWLILVAMVFDALDGKVARLTGQVSEIGAQLDSLCDAVTFGVAPAFLVWKTISLLPPQVIHVPQKVAWVFAVTYMACVLLRLARFNVETPLTESDHLYFSGLPSPAAAGVIASLSILNINIFTDSNYEYQNIVYVFFLIIPIIAMVLGLLMVSKIRYYHILNAIAAGKKKFSVMVQVIFVIAFSFLFPYLALPIAMIFLLYAFSPPIVALVRPQHGKEATAKAESTSNDSPGSTRS